MDWNLRAKAYSLSASDVDDNWNSATVIAEVKTNGDNAQVRNTTVIGTSGRYVRIIIERFVFSVCQINDVKIYPLRQTQQLPSGVGAYAAVDGKVDTYWKSDANSALSKQWVLVDLGQEYKLQSIEIDWERRPDQYDISVGNDNVKWDYTLSVSDLSGPLPVTVSTTIDGAVGRYVRINATVATNYIGIREIAVYADASDQTAGTSKW